MRDIGRRSFLGVQELQGKQKLLTDKFRIIAKFFGKDSQESVTKNCKTELTFFRQSFKKIKYIFPKDTALSLSDRDQEIIENKSSNYLF